MSRWGGREEKKARPREGAGGCIWGLRKRPSRGQTSSANEKRARKRPERDQGGCPREARRLVEGKR